MRRYVAKRVENKCLDSTIEKNYLEAAPLKYSVVGAVLKFSVAQR